MASDAQRAALPKSYEFKDIENKWYEYWENHGMFKPNNNPDSPSFSMVIPPPNVTGVLHIGHALNDTLQDILIRYKRMDGYNTLWVPGTDHAGIATQNVVERQLAQEGLTRYDLGREKFIERVWKWRSQSGGRIIEQLKRLGCSCDWSHERFTMDEGLSKAVRKVFVELYKQGLIYKGDYIINWCPRCHTALADIEVEHEPREGKLWYIEYPLEDGSDSLTVATTRPETLLGDTAVAVNPDDPRYQKFIGKNLILPLMNRKIPVVADPHVDSEFGTGAVKVTPAHDFNDFEIASRHSLPAINIFDEDAILNENAGPYRGLDRYEARKKVLNDLEAKGLLKKTEPHSHAVGTCYRCKTVVEPRLSKQWFVKVAPLAKPALKAMESGDTQLVPPSWLRTYQEWMTNIKDWCISRQIWWGHRIPAWTCKKCGHITVAISDPETCSKCGSTDIEQESDVLDTWFSSALWPFSTLGWPEQTDDLKTFYPTSVLITSFDILFFWVARMMMMGIHFMEEVPFKYVYLHALVRDANGEKMSKSKGNVIDPLVIIDKYGTDAMRFTLAAFAAQGRDIKLAEDRIEGYRHFINKIWNAARLVLLYCPKDTDQLLSSQQLLEQQDKLNLAQKWILSRTSKISEEVRQALDKFDFDVAARTLYRFFWHEFCDWYLEVAKPSLNEEGPGHIPALSVAIEVLNRTLRLLHPIIPFVTEELWHYLPNTQGSIMIAPYPDPVPEWDDQDAEYKMKELMDMTTGLRNLRSELGIHPGAQIPVLAICHTEDIKDLLSTQEQAIKTLAKVESLQLLPPETERPKGAGSVILEEVELFVPLKGLVDINAEIEKLTKEVSKIEKEMKKSLAKLANENFLSRAPKDIVQKERDKLERFETKLAKIKEHEKRLKEIT